MCQNQSNGVKSNGARKLDPDINGMGGELAVCKYFNRFPDLTIGPHYNGFDLVAKGKKIDVKTTTYDPGYLQCKQSKRISDADIYILVIAKFPQFTICGGVTSQSFLQPCNLKDMGYGLNYTLERSQLVPLEQLFA